MLLPLDGRPPHRLLSTNTAGSAQTEPEQAEGSLLREFQAEVSMLSSLRHPNICLFLGACLKPPKRAIITELVPRGSLWDVLRQPLPVSVLGYTPRTAPTAQDPWPTHLIFKVRQASTRPPHLLPYWLAPTLTMSPHSCVRWLTARRAA